MGRSVGSLSSSATGWSRVRTWVKQADVDDGVRPSVSAAESEPGVSAAESERLRELERENRELRRANEIVRRAATFFGAELDRQQRR
jgi:transposase